MNPRLRPRLSSTLTLATALVSVAACSGEPYVETRTRTLPAATDCESCHAPHTPGDPFAAVALSFMLTAPLDWEPSRLGYSVLHEEGACEKSCHLAHSEDAVKRKQWAASPHGDSHLADAAWSEVLGSSTCTRCHNGASFATYADPSNSAYPDWTPPPSTFKTAWYPTCDSCHDKTLYPTPDNQRLRFQTSEVTLVSGSTTATPASTFVVDGRLDVGRQSATCILCHQYRESGASLWTAMHNRGVDLDDQAGLDVQVTGVTSSVRPHYGGVGATLYSQKGYELPGYTYSSGNTFHQDLSCVGCHMYNKAGDTSRGGHTVKPAGCERCHGMDFTTDDFPRVGRLLDVDGNGQAEAPAAELKGLVLAITDALATRGVYYNDARTGFYTTADTTLQDTTTTFKTWTPRLLVTAFNLVFVAKEPAFFVHNYRYAAQLLRDSYRLLTGNTLAGVRPATADDRPARPHGSP